MFFSEAETSSYQRFSIPHPKCEFFHKYGIQRWKAGDYGRRHRCSAGMRSGTVHRGGIMAADGEPAWLVAWRERDRQLWPFPKAGFA